MKKIALASALLLALSMTACGDDETGGSGGSGNTGNSGGSGGGAGGSGNAGGTGNTGGEAGGAGNAGGGGGTGGGGAMCTMGVEATDIADNHNQPHSLMTIPAADVTAGVDQTYTLELGGGMGGHTHDITVTAADFTTLLTGATVTVTSTIGGNNDHSHDVTLDCP